MVFSWLDSLEQFRDQNYEDLRNGGRITGHLFEDPEFPADEKTLGLKDIKDVIWRRPGEMCEKPKLLIDDANIPKNIIQGKLSNSWLITALTCLSNETELWSKVVPYYKEQDWDDLKTSTNYVGIFHFHIWRFGQWIDVVVDDRLPTLDNEYLFTSSTNPNEFWPALLEKAYAKLCGSYAALDHGELGEAFVDFTGGITESINLMEDGYRNSAMKQSALFEELRSSFLNKTLMAAATPVRNERGGSNSSVLADDEKSAGEDEVEVDKPDVGLILGQAYGILDVRRITFESSGYLKFLNRNDGMEMVKLKNPWGGHPWKGSFSKESEEWKRMDQAWVKKNLSANETEFWMSFEDFCQYFMNFAICRILNTKLLSLSKRWQEWSFHSEWSTRENRAGGCSNHIDTFLRNPQFVFHLKLTDDEFLFYLMQKSRVGYEEMKNHTIGFTIVKVEDNRPFRIHDIGQQEIVKSSVFRNSRSIFLRLGLSKGRYIVIPTTFEPNVDAAFMLRIFAGSNIRPAELKLDKPLKNVCHCLCGCLHFCKYPVMATQVTVLKILDFQSSPDLKSDSMLVKLKCEGSKMISEPNQWNFKAVFYRRNPINEPINFDIFNSGYIKNTFIGHATFSMTEDMDRKEFELLLGDAGPNQKCLLTTGKLLIRVTNCRHLSHI